MQVQYLDFDKLDDVTPVQVKRWDKEIVDKVKKDAKIVRDELSRRPDLSGDAKERFVQILTETENVAMKGMSAIIVLCGTMQELKDNGAIENPEEFQILMDDVDVSLSTMSIFLANLRNVKRNASTKKK